ncbi:DNA-binding transcriptional regulator GbsR (MarR family) [Saccharopolyspora erythraea NRRL 2338]|nr:MarR family transcriptional regulator [Saccharopolyspora erythraea]PFG99481.1 DNA-binding transcriptional regulator GbsR (MarR family) [Saccharopolyspora erythraea NRRL 2338]QRK89385.1 MarR family transcriptional regulator [Saccharopolyspora erythraea]
MEQREQQTGDEDEGAVLRFVERFALDLANAGVPRMAARVFVGILVAESGNRTAAELADLLGVSAAAVSGAVRYLEQVRLVVREREPGQRRDHFVVRDDMWYETLTNRDEQLGRLMRTLEEGVRAVGEETRAGARLEDTRSFFEFFSREIPLLMQKWRALQDERS